MAAKSARGPRKWRGPSRRGWWILGSIAAALVVLLVLFDWNWFKGPVERAVTARTGRSFHIGGDLDVDLGRRITIRASQLEFGNAPWARLPNMAAARQAEVDVMFWPLLRGKVDVAEIRLDKPLLRLETGPKGKGNWVFKPSDGDGKPPVLRKLWIEDGRLSFVDAAEKTDIDIRLNSMKPDNPADSAPVAIAGKGKWAGNAFTLKGTAESPLELTNSERPFHLDLRASAGPTHAHARGQLVNPLSLQDFDLKLALSGQDLEDLYPLIGVAIPSTPPYQLDGRFTRDGNTWRYDDFTGKVGDSDLGGDAAVTVGGERPFLKADLVSKRLDFDDLAGFVGGQPQTGASESANPQQRRQSAQQTASARVLPDTPYDLGKLRSMDADVVLKAKRINAPSLPIDDMDAHLKLKAGVLRLDPLNFGVASGDIRSTIQMDASRPTIRTRADVAVSKLDLGKLFPDAELTRTAIGRIGGNVVINGTGNSIAAILGSANGDATLGMGKGRISNLLMELAGLDVAESLKFLLTDDKQVPVRCAFGDFDLRQGVMHTRSLAFDSTDTIIVGKGDISLKDETLDLELRPRPKDRSIVALRSPLVIGGTFKDPSFHPDFARLGLRGAVALALGSIAPPAALLATLELGPGEDSGCGGQYAK
ncbi:AsmA family protein [Pseudoxanthomonas dokdonensis]|uniref:Membrane protein n=1 Tax=Pseudoxanthomonas dokdonensis TaxID=344882 RepID=A0A0R0CVR5_9GAMM|nr:AsmA family protein [Pseudoxanthomonas dokdonensis]KRG70215.1 membrane protein [Pseudoxanthomonas dokdonensis]